MAKRRTRKDKVAAKHDFTISWEPTTSVKSQKLNYTDNGMTNVPPSKKTVSTGMSLDLASIKKDLVKSISVAGFIILFELVIYFFWK